MTARVRADLSEGYYSVPIATYSKSGDSRQAIAYGEVLIWVTKPGANDKDNDPDRQISFTLGEGQATPYGDYPNVMGFAINMRNSGISEARDVTASMVLRAKTATSFRLPLTKATMTGNTKRSLPVKQYRCHTALRSVPMPTPDTIR